MTERTIDDGYAPFGLILEADSLGFVETIVQSSLGSCVARHRVDRTSSTATVFLHGASGAWTTWTALLQSATEQGIPIENPVLLDLPGWGDATITEDEGDVTVLAISSLVTAVTERLGYSTLHLVGHSLGGFIALHMAANWPDRVLSVGMVSGTTFSVIRSVERPFARFFELPGFTMLLGVMRFLAVLGAAGRTLVRVFGRTGILRLVFAPLFRHGRRMPVSLLTATANDLRPRAFVAAAEVARGYDAASIWSRIECEVRATKGDRDVFVTDADFAELARVVPRSIRTVIDDCGHFGIVERPAAVLEALGLRVPTR